MILPTALEWLAFGLGLERTGGFEKAAFREIEPFRRKVLRKSRCIPLATAKSRKIIKLSIFYGENECIEWVSIGRN